MNRRIFTAALSALLLTGITGVSAFAQNSAQGSTWTIDKNHAQTNFQIRHMGVSTVRGSISGVTGTIVWDQKDPSKSSVEATIDTNTVNTNNSTRDTDLKSDKYFNVAKYPTMTFKSTSVSRVNGKLQVGDIAGAQVASKNAKLWCWVSFGIGISGFVLWMLVAGIGMLHQMGSH